MLATTVSQVPKSEPGIPRSTAPRTVAPGFTWTPGLMAPPIWADSAVGIMRIAATAPIIESLRSMRLVPAGTIMAAAMQSWLQGEVELRKEHAAARPQSLACHRYPTRSRRDFEIV